MKRVKKFGVILVLNKSEERSEKRVVFVQPLFLREREIDVWKKILSERNFLVNVGLFKAFF